MESIRRTINVSSISPIVLERKTFGKALFIIDAVPADANDRLVKYSSYQEVVDALGSNTESERFAKSYFLNGAYGTTPPYMWVLKVDITIGAEDLATVLHDDALVKPEDYYLISSDENFTTDQKEVIADTVELYKDNWYMCNFEYTNVDAYDLGITTDLTSVLAAKSITHSFANYAHKPGGENEYLSAAVSGFLSGVDYTATRGKNQPAKKELNNITVNGLTDSNIGKLIEKNYNYYTATTTIKDNNWYGLNSRNVSGDSFLDIITIDYMSYNLTVSLAELLKNEAIIGFDRTGYGLVEQELDRNMQEYLRGGILADNGVTADGELFPFGYKIQMPALSDATAADKLAGNLKEIVIRVLPKYSVTSFDITLQVEV